MKNYLTLFLTLFLLIILSLLVSVQRQISLSRGQNNKVILISADAVSASHVGIYGYERETTPNIDKLAREGIFFENAYSPTPWTLPAHTSMLNGLHPFDNEIFNNQYIFRVPEKTLLTTLFKNNGYKTAAFVGAELLGYNFFQKDFDVFISPKEGEHFIKDMTITNEFLPWLEENYKEDFFVFIHYFQAAEYNRRECNPFFTTNMKRPTKEIFIEKGVGEFMCVSCTNELAKYYKEETEFLKASYDDNIRCVDKNIEKIIESLKDLNIYDNTTIIIVSDHGTGFNHSFFQGTNLYEESVRIPFIIKSPLLEKTNHKIDYLISLQDVFPILIRAFDLDNKKNPTDNNLYSIIKKKIGNRKDLFLMAPSIGLACNMEDTTLKLKDYPHILKQECIEKGKDPFIYRALINDNKKIIFSNKDIELYDLKKDRLEQNNLAEDPRYSNFILESEEKIKSFFYPPKEVFIFD